MIAKIARGEKDALEALFSVEAPRLIGVARRITRDLQLAEDVVQESFVRIWRSAASFDPARGSASGWLSTIVRNRSLNAVRDGARLEFHDPAGMLAMEARLEDATQAMNRLSDRDALRICLDQLDERKRQAVLLCYVTGLNHGEAAATLKAPLGTVKAWVRRGVIALQECLS